MLIVSAFNEHGIFIVSLMTVCYYYYYYYYYSLLRQLAANKHSTHTTNTTTQNPQKREIKNRIKHTTIREILHTELQK